MGNVGRLSSSMKLDELVKEGVGGKRGDDGIVKVSADTVSNMAWEHRVHVPQPSTTARWSENVSSSSTPTGFSIDVTSANVGASTLARALSASVALVRERGKMGGVIGR